MGESYRFFKQPTPDNADVSGRWEVTFTADDGKTSQGIALIEQQHDRVTGTVITPTGDHRFLEGQVRGEEFALSTFAGDLVYGDFGKAAQAVRRYRKDLDIEFPALIAGISDTDEASKALPALTGVHGFPTSILVDRHGKVRRIHTGFTGPGTGRYYDDYVRKFRSFTAELLEESADAL